MLNNQQYLKTIAVFALIVALAVAGISATAFADGHTDENVEIDGEGEENIRYSTIVGLYGEPFDDSSNEYLIEASNIEEYDESTLQSVTLDGNVVPSSALPTEQLNVNDGTELGVRVNTEVYDQFVLSGQGDRVLDPQGDYVLREPIQGASVEASDQHPEAPQGIDVALNSFEVNGNKVVTATSETNANQVSESDYTWVVSLGPESGIVEDGTGSYVGDDVVVLLNKDNYNDINYDGVDGIYNLSNVGSDDDYYPGSLTFTSGPFDSDFVELPTQGQLELDRGTNHIPESTQVAVEYTDVNNPEFVDEPVESGTFSSGDQITLNNDFVQVNPSFTSTQSFDDTSLNFDLLSDRQVEVTYEKAHSTADKVEVGATAPGESPSGTYDETSEWVVVDDRTIRTSNTEILLDSLNLIDNDGSLSTSDLEILEANKGNGITIRFPDLTGEKGVSSDRFELEYTRLEDTGDGTRETVSNEVLVSYGTPVTLGQKNSVNNGDVMLEVSGSSVDFDTTFDATLKDQTLSTPDTIDLVAEGDIESAFDPAEIDLRGDEEVKFLRSIDQGVVEEFGTHVDGDTYLNAINPGQNPSVELGFDVAAEQEIDLSYTHYNDSTTGVSETVITGGSSGELGPTGQYQINDPRTSEFDMELSDVSSGDFSPSVESGSSFTVGIEEGNFDPIDGSNVTLSQYRYTLGAQGIAFAGGDSEVTVNNDGTSELQYELDHDHEQVDQDFIVALETEDGQRDDSVTLTSNVPSGNSLGSGGTGAFVVDSLRMDVGINYTVQAIHNGSTIAEEEIGSGKNYDNYRLNLNQGEDLDDIDGEDVTVRLMRYEGFNESKDSLVPVRDENLDTSDGDVNVGAVVEDTVTIDSESGQLSFDPQSEGTSLDAPLSQDWTLLPQFELGDKNADDQRVFVNRLNKGEEPNGPVNIPIGSEIVVSGNEFEPGDTLTLRREEGEDSESGEDANSVTVDLTVEESDTVNEDQVVINTSIPQAPEPGELEDRFEVVEPQSGDVVFNYGTTDQNLDAEVDPAQINLNRETTAELNVSSDLTDYDVLISSEQLDAEELLDIFPQEMENEYNIREEAPDDDEVEQVRLEQLNDRPETIELEVSGLSAQEYGLQIATVGSGASDSVTFETAFGSEGDANFADPVELNDTQTFRVAEGDTARIGVQLEETDTATFSFADSDYDLQDVKIEADNGGEEVVLTMDTYLADGERVNGDEVEFTDVFSVEGGEFVNTPSLPPVADVFETGLYPMNLEVDGRETDLATLVVEDRETKNVNTYVMPRGVEMNLDNLQEDAVQQDQVAMEDTFIIEMQMSGFDSPELLTNETDPAKLVDPYKRAELDDEFDTAQEFVNQEVEGVDSVANASQINLDVEGEKPRNSPSPHMLIDEADEVRTIVEEGPENRLFLFFDLTQTKFDNFNPAHDMVSAEDHLADYEMNLNFSESYKYVEDEEDTEADLTEEVGVNERVVETRLPSQKVEEEGLETRFQLQPEVNSTITGETYVAPGTELSIILRDDIEDTVQESPLTLEKEVEVQEGDGEFNSVREDFDLSTLEEGREMTLQFFGINEDREPAIVAEPQVPPEITELSVSFDGEGVRVGDEVTFDSTIENVDPLALQYDWDFDDGSESSAPAPTQVFEEAGNYNVTLEVEDPATGLTDTAETEVVVTGVPRTAPEIIELIGPDAQVNVGEANEFAVVARDDQVSADELIYEWDFADGTTATGITASHTYGVGDTYEVQVTVSDPENPGELQTTESILVEVVSEDDGGDNGEENETTYDLTVNALDSEAGEALPNAQIQVQDGNTQESVDVGQTDTSGQYVAELEEGNYIVQATASGYEDFSTGIQVSGNDSVQADMVPEGSGGEDENPDQPGFTLILAALGLTGAGGFIYYRRRMS